MLACVQSLGRLRVAAFAWSAARASVHLRDPATPAMRSWAWRTTQRYKEILFQLAHFHDSCAMPAGTLACLSQFLFAKVVEAAARSTLQNVNSAVCGAEDQGMLRPAVAPMHWRLSKGRQPCGSQPYFGPYSLCFLCRAVSDKEEHITVALCFLSLRWLFLTVYLRAGATLLGQLKTSACSPFGGFSFLGWSPAWW